MTEIKIHPERMRELYSVLFDERENAEKMIRKLILFKECIKEQEFHRSSLSEVHFYVDSLINLMEVLCENVETLQNNATEIAEEFSWIDQQITNYTRNPNVLSYSKYEQEKLNSLYRSYYP